MKQHISSSLHAISCRRLPCIHVQSIAIKIVHVELIHYKDKRFIEDFNSNMGNSIDHYFGVEPRGKEDDVQELSLDIPKTLQSCHIVIADPQD